ncbi:phospholipid-transporting ATPase-like protein [Leptomonas pyrrhocoris]|uniref:Phospholipid-transporting ATPase-like protein n=1 Tax=Leptomonas pyrrhocoris TaxID=157538 RepID=A0A0N0DWX4_LEPPY|nr:phospholipid-transporting ATPase-like protein [Leptomonas pyrrhocoris]KPA82335.1 phospholipid-transporting ATPase-like protein [Leptomonas pyrrhocoris]|eukprot:XP_015660774.1 phospholipid-transporting ATPase-like protein [Leptomonas pyrrhocoris]
MKQWVQQLFTKPAKDRSSETRIIELNDPHGGTQYCDNRICSSKYNIFTFLPLNLYEQFHRPINIYFLTVAALQFIPSVAPVSPLTTIFPITTAFLINAVKEGVDDLRRHRQDVEVNERLYQRVRPGTLQLEEVASADIRVGDLLLLHPFEVVPSDVVVLLTSHDGGGAYITTESLDGETGSKQRFALLHHVFKYTSNTPSPVASLPHPSGLNGGASPDAAVAAAATSHATSALPGKPTDNPPRDVRSCCATAEEHQLHCLRYALSTRFALSSEGPNSHLHSYHGAATIRVPQSSPVSWRDRTLPAPNADAGHHDGSVDASVDALHVADGVDAAEISPIVTVSHNLSPLPSEAALDEGFPRPLPMPLMSSMTLRRSGHASPTMMANSRCSNDEHSRLLAANNSPGEVAPSTSTRSAFDSAAPVADAVEYFDGPEQTLSVNIDNVIYASSRTGNTHFIIALVVFTGRETKTSMTRNVPPTKWATIDHLFNYLAMFIFAVQVVLVATCAFFSCTRLRKHASLWYLGGDADPVDFSEYFPILPLRYLMMLSPMVPLSFKVMVEISKAYVSYVIRWDEDIKTSEESASVNNSALAEELGQVEYVLSDKTGTLTANTMTFSALATATDAVFSSTYDSVGAGSGGGGSDDEQPLCEVGKTIKAGLAAGCVEDYYLMLTMVFCNTIERTLSPRFSGAGGVHTRSSSYGSATRSTASEAASPSPSRWMSASPDEVALVDGADQCGFPLRHRSRSHATVALWGDSGTSLEVELVYTLPFSSDRGMMSVLLRCPDVPGMAFNAARSTGKGSASSGFTYVLLIKGADEKVLPRCTDKYSSTHLEDITNRLARFSRRGLRTLVYGYRFLSEEEAKEALRRFETVKTSFAAAATREAELQRIYALLEHDFTYCGITAVKDELQEGVAQTLAQLRHANIRVWMLTGDKTETAKQTAVACGLLTSEDRVVTLTPPNEDLLTATEHLAYVSVRLGEIMQLLAEEGTQDRKTVTRWQKLKEWSRRFFWRSSGLCDFVHEFTRPATCERIRPVDHPLVTQPLSLIEAQSGPVSKVVLDAVPAVCGAVRRRPGLYFGSAFTASGNYNTCGLKRGYCVALSGKTLRLLEAEDVASHGHSAVVRLFRGCLLQARSVVCSRTAPSLKSYVVDLVKRSGHITLAIGDGGNDVPMLQAAHVGVGIKGLEGSQAKLASDFAIGQFRFLSKLILVHGHTAYQRTAMIVQQSFWKTVLIAWVQVLYNISTDFSGVSYWDSLSLTLYNAIPTVPVTFLCVMDMPLSQWILRTTPQLYSMSQRGRYMSATTFYGYIARAFLHGTMVYYLSMGLQSGSGALVSNGWVLDRGGDFYAVYIAVVTIHTYTVCTESHAITIAHWNCFLFSVYSCFISFWIYARVPTSPNGTFSVLLTSPSFYLAYVGLTVAVCASLAIYAMAKVMWFPDALQFQRLLMVHLGERSWLRRSVPVRVLRTFFQDDNPSHFWKSISPYHALKYYPPPKLSFFVNEDVGEDEA